jgi:SAM-dependent methyltransferase
VSPKFVPENHASLAKEIAEAGISTASIACAPGSEFEKIRVRPVALKSGEAYQLEQFRGPKVFHRNVDRPELESELARIFEGGVMNAEFTLATGPGEDSAGGDNKSSPAQTIRIATNRRGEATVLRSAHSRTSTAATSKVLTLHNRPKQYILEEGKPVPFLVDLGVMTAEGAVVKAKYDKFRQVNRFLEFIQDVVSELESAASGGEITVVDFGCGKSYLTFAVYHYLANIRKLPVRIIGLDLKEDVIAECANLAARYGYGKLHFSVGDIASFTGVERADMVITLHACDTATDFALAQAVRWNASVILSVPCCQHELNAQLASNERPVAPGREILEGAFKYGIIRERMAALLTDAMRAELLESAGYRTQILEFIDMSHTPKNLLVRAIRDRAIRDRASDDAAGRFARLRDFLGVEPTLERILKKESGE